MTEINAFGGIAGGLGLLLLGLWLTTEGLTLPGGKILRRHLRTWTSDRKRSFSTGLLIALLVPSSSGVTSAAIGLVNSGLVLLRNVLWVVAGCSLGGVITAWLVVAVASSADLPGLALTYVALGILLAWTGPETTRGSWGKALGGLGVLLLGLHLLEMGFLRATPSFDLDALGIPDALIVVAAVLFGVGISAALRSSSAAVALILFAASVHTVHIFAAVGLLIGANLGGALPAALTLRSGTPNARRVAVAYLMLHSVAAFMGLVLLACFAPIIGQLSIGLGSPVIALALFHTIFAGLGVALFAAGSRPLLAHVSQRFVEDEAEGFTSNRLDSNALIVPDLALEGLIQEVQEVGYFARSISQQVLGVQKLTEFRKVQDLGAVHGKSEAVDEFVAQLSRAHIPSEVSNSLIELPRASHRYRRLADELVAYDERNRSLELELEPRLSARLRQLESAVQHLIEGPEPFDLDYDSEQTEGELESIAVHVRDLNHRLLSGCSDGSLGAEQVGVLLDRTHTLYRIARISVDATASLARTCFPRIGPARASGQGGEWVDEWLPESEPAASVI